MIKISKLILSTFLIFSTIIVISKPVSATNILDNPIESVKEVHLNEFGALLQNIKMYENRVQLFSANKEDYYEYLKLVNYKEGYIRFLYNQKELTIDELKEQNYTENQIEAIKSFDGSDTLAVRASASIAVSGATKAKTSTKHGVRFSWSWLGTPFFAGPGIEDGVAVRWQSTNQGAVLIHTVIHADSNAFVRYGNTKSNLTITNFPASRAAEAKFCMAGLNGSESSWANSGVFDIYVKIPSGTSTTIAHTSFEFVYAHTTINFNLSVNFDYPTAGFGISVDRGELMYRKNWETSL